MNTGQSAAIAAGRCRVSIEYPMGDGIRRYEYKGAAGEWVYVGGPRVGYYKFPAPAADGSTWQAWADEAIILAADGILVEFVDE